MKINVSTQNMCWLQIILVQWLCATHLDSFLLLRPCSGVLDDMEYGCYCQWFDHVLKKDPPQVDLIGIEAVLCTDAQFSLVSSYSLFKVKSWSVLPEITTARKKGRKTCYSGIYKWS